MIIEVLIRGVFTLINWLIGLLPDLSSLPSWITDFLNMVGYTLNFIPQDVWLITLANVGLWQLGLIGWACVEWVYKKIPGVS